MEGGYDLSAIESNEDAKTLASAQEPSVESVFKKHNPSEELPDDCELYYYVSIRWIEPDTKQYTIEVKFSEELTDLNSGKTTCR